MTYYVTIPSLNVRRTVWEHTCLSYTDNEFLFKQYLSSIYVNGYIDDYELYEFEASDADELFKQVCEQTGYILTVNHELEIFESINNPQCAFYSTVDVIDDARTWDYTFNTLEILWSALVKLKDVMHIIRFPNSVSKVIPILLDKYCFLCSVFMYDGTLSEIDNGSLQEEIRKLLLDAKIPEDEISYFSIAELMDDVMLLFSLFSSKE